MIWTVRSGHTDRGAVTIFYIYSIIVYQFYAAAAWKSFAISLQFGANTF